MNPLSKSFLLLLSTRLISQIEVHAQAGQQYIPESAKLLSQYIQHESVTGNEKSAGQFFSSACKEQGLHVEVFSDQKDKYNFSASLYPLSWGKPNIVFLNHIDVVPPGDTAAWTYPPFSGRIANDMVWGRGAIDLKGLAVMQVLALAGFKKQNPPPDLPYNVTVLCVSQEETSGTKGAAWVVDELLERLNPLVVFGEGGAGISELVESNPEQVVFCVSTCEKQALWLSLKIKMPTSGHGSVPPAEYANQVMVNGLARLIRSKQKIQINTANVDMFKSLGKMEKGARGLALKNIKLFKPLLAPVLRKDPKVLSVVSNTITLTNLSNPPGAINQIAQETTATLDCRLLPGVDKEKFIKKVTRAFKSRHLYIDITLETANANPSPLRNEFFLLFKESIQYVYTGAKVVPYLFPAYSDNNIFRNKNIPVYGIKPVHLTQDLLLSVHNIDERIPIQSLESGIEVYGTFLNKVMSSKEQPITRNQ